MNHISDKGPDSRIHKSCQNLRVKTTQSDNEQKTQMDYFIKEGLQMQINMQKLFIISHGECKLK